ncbi:MAG: tRNA (guanosine(37)-N1)-methyltransferase TrmD [Candidatus Moranbacteria bacterium]|nr:tRNA (guanosine(37)-N1)-methyltransferase TrmD [Candidatus Moranbacteria bacterium]
MQFNVITIFPRILDSYFAEAQIKRAVQKSKVKIKVHDLRNYTSDKHRTTDDIPYGGGAGMVMKIEPIYKNVTAILKESHCRRKDIRVILLSAKGKAYSQKTANRLARRYRQIILISGRYEGVDERVAEHIADEEISLGPYIISGGELGAAVIIDSVTRLIPGVVGNRESLKEESFTGKRKNLEYPQFTRPENFQGFRVPKVLLTGDHKKIKIWRDKLRTKKEE